MGRESKESPNTLSNHDCSRNAPRIHLYPPNRPKKCLACGKPLKELYRTKSRTVRMLGAVQEIVEHIFVCANRECAQYHKKLHPERYTPPRSAFHFEVIIEVGRLRRVENKTFQEITDILSDRKVALGKSSSCAQHLFRYFEIYELIWAEQALDYQCQGQDTVLAIDGAKPENGQETLYLVTDGLTQTVYNSAWLLYSGTTDIANVFRTTKTLELNVVGLVSDKQAAILLAGREVFGEVPHQYCQFHWFLDALCPLFDRDRHLNKELKKSLRKLREITRASKQAVKKGTLPTKNRRIVAELETFLTVILQGKGKAPFVWMGIRNWQRAKMLLVEAFEVLVAHQQPIFTGPVRTLPPAAKSLIHMTRILAETLESHLFEAWNVKVGSQWATSLENYLNPENVPVAWLTEKCLSRLAKRRVVRFLNGLKDAGNTFLATLRARLMDRLTRWEDGLFVCFDYPFIPRTNNSLEHYIYRLKQKQTKTSGRRNNHSTLRHQQCFNHELQFPPQEPFLECCRKTTAHVYYQVRQRYLERLEPLIRENRIKRDFPGMLREAFNKIKEEISLSSECT